LNSLGLKASGASRLPLTAHHSETSVWPEVRPTVSVTVTMMGGPTASGSTSSPNSFFSSRTMVTLGSSPGLTWPPAGRQLCVLVVHKQDVPAVYDREVRNQVFWPRCWLGDTEEWRTRLDPSHCIFDMCRFDGVQRMNFHELPAHAKVHPVA